MPSTKKFRCENAITRLAGAILLEQNEYAIQERYIGLGSLATMSENPPMGLPANAGLRRSCRNGPCLRQPCSVRVQRVVDARLLFLRCA
jgi:hypothetical protein